MKKLRLFILIFFLALTIPLSYLVLRTYSSLEQEEAAELRYFAETLFDKMEEELAELVQREETRPVEEYGTLEQRVRLGKKGVSSPLEELPKEKFILGYFQNSPDGSLQTPLKENVSSNNQKILQQLEAINTAFNKKRAIIPAQLERERNKDYDAQKEQEEQLAQALKQKSVADRYLSKELFSRQKSRLGKSEKRVEEISVAQAQNIVTQPETLESEQWVAMNDAVDGQVATEGYPAKIKELSSPVEDLSFTQETTDSHYSLQNKNDFVESKGAEPAPAISGYFGEPEGTFKVEIDPLQSVLIDADHFYVFRRIVLNNQVYRQGFVLKVNEFLDHLSNTTFRDQPLAQFTNLRLSILNQGQETRIKESGAGSVHPEISITRHFPRPFSFLQATLDCDRIPDSPGRQTLNIMIVVLAMVILLGLFALYQSVRVVFDLSERRSGFVSSVTHELKTPLTNIRMYIEMLEQGIASNKEREQEYFRILGSESSRLSRLINNVLEFSKLERKQRPLNMIKGDLSEVLKEVQDIMGEKIRLEGFTLSVENSITRPFQYDREVMIQILINLLENSVKFGKNSEIRELQLRAYQDGNQTKIAVSDTGPGIEPQSLKKVFDDFFREENSLTRSTKGTGIGLSLVKKFVQAMGGKVKASNNPRSGCTITITL